VVEEIISHGGQLLFSGEFFFERFEKVEIHGNSVALLGATRRSIADQTVHGMTNHALQDCLSLRVKKSKPEVRACSRLVAPQCPV
jgi:hypothetical protein